MHKQEKCKKLSVKLYQVKWARIRVVGVLGNEECAFIVVKEQ